MIAETAIFTCSICGEPSRDICVACTKDTCTNHRCYRCKRCSDCCECEMPLSASQSVPEMEPVQPEPELSIETVEAEPEVVSETVIETGDIEVPDIPELFRADPAPKPAVEKHEDPQPE